MALSFQNGEYGLPSGTSQITIPFPVSFDSPPAAVLPIIVNDGPTDLGGEPKYLITGQLAGWDESGFDLDLSAPTNRVDYRVVWVAGDFSALFAITTQTRKLSQLRHRTKDIQPSDLVMIVDGTGAPVTEVMALSLFLKRILELVPAPASSIAPGEPRQIGLDDTYIHTYFNGLWKAARRDGATVIQSAPWRMVNATATAVAYDRIMVNTTAGSVAVSLPLNPAVGVEVLFDDPVDTWPTNNAVIQNNGQKIAGSLAPVYLDETKLHRFVFVGGSVGWKITT